MNNPILATNAMPTLKPTYGFASTAALIEALAPTGWHPVEQKVSRVKDLARDGFQRHIVTLENPALPEIPGMSEDNQSRPRITIVNSHDATTALRMFLGFLRFACLNGIIAGTGLREFRAVHTQSLPAKVAEGVEYLTAGVPDLAKQLQFLQQSVFSPEAKEEFVRKMVDARLAHVEAIDVNYNSALTLRRTEDQGENAFVVLNRVQEAMMRGGVRYNRVVNFRNDTGEVISSEIRPASTRKLSSIPQAVKLNRMAYDLAMQLAA